MPPASALPPGGAATVNTPGTSSSVSPDSVEQCGSVSYEVSGFPAGETVNVKIDDGNVSGGDKSVQGRVWLMNKQLGMMVEPLAASKSLAIFLPVCIRYVS